MIKGGIRLFAKKSKVAVAVLLVAALFSLISGRTASAGNIGGIVISGDSDVNMTVSEDTSVIADAPVTVGSAAYLAGIDKYGSCKAAITVLPGVSLNVTAASVSADEVYAFVNSDVSSDISFTGSGTFSASSDKEKCIVSGISNLYSGNVLFSGDITVNTFGKYAGYYESGSTKINILHAGAETLDKGKTIFSGGKTTFNVRTDGGSAAAVNSAAKWLNYSAYMELNAKETNIFMEGVNLQQGVNYLSQDELVKPMEMLAAVRATTSGDEEQSVVDVNGALNVTISADNYFLYNGKYKVGNNAGLIARGKGAGININGDLDIAVRNIDYAVSALNNSVININESGKNDVKIDGILEVGYDACLNMTINRDTDFHSGVTTQKGIFNLKSVNNAVYNYTEFDFQNGGSAVLGANTTLSADRLLVSGNENALTVEPGAKVFIRSVMDDNLGDTVEGSLTVYVDDADRANVIIPEASNLKVTYEHRTNDDGSGGCSAGAGALALLAMVPMALRKKK